METPPPAEDTTAAAAVTTLPHPAWTLDASQVADYLLSRRHLAAAFELYQDYLADASPPPPGTRKDAASQSNGTEDGTVKRENNDGEVEARDALEAYFAHPQRFPLADLQRYANAVDSECSVGAHSPLPSRRSSCFFFSLSLRLIKNPLS